MIDGEVIEKKMDMIEEGLAYLRRTRELDRGEFLASFEKTQAAKHTLQETIEGCIDIANHLLAAKGLPRSETYSGMFRVLGNEGLLPAGLADRLAEMARFRNLLVHRYAEVDNERIYQILHERLTDVEEFLREVSKIPAKENDPRGTS